jgi:hypothetical protein
VRNSRECGHEPSGFGAAELVRQSLYNFSQDTFRNFEILLGLEVLRPACMSVTVF